MLLHGVPLNQPSSGQLSTNHALASSPGPWLKPEPLAFIKLPTGWANPCNMSLFQIQGLVASTLKPLRGNKGCLGFTDGAKTLFKLSLFGLAGGPRYVCFTKFWPTSASFISSPLFAKARPPGTEPSARDRCARQGRSMRSWPHPAAPNCSDAPKRHLERGFLGKEMGPNQNGGGGLKAPYAVVTLGYERRSTLLFFPGPKQRPGLGDSLEDHSSERSGVLLNSWLGSHWSDDAGVVFSWLCGRGHAFACAPLPFCGDPCHE